LLLDAVAAALIGFAVHGMSKPNAFRTAADAPFVGIFQQGLTRVSASYYTRNFIKGAVLVVTRSTSLSRYPVEEAGGVADPEP
jgi:simple sugar transport system permease protein